MKSKAKETPPDSHSSTFLIQAGAIKMTEATLEAADLCPFSTRAWGVGDALDKNKNRINNCASGSLNSKDNEFPVQKVLAAVPKLSGQWKWLKSFTSLPT